MSDSSEQVKPPPPENRVSTEQVKKWIETGLSHEAVAVYGTSTSNFLGILKTGIVPPYRGQGKDLVDYQTELQAQGKFLYYGNPILENIRRINPDFSGDLEKGLNPLYVDRSDFEETFSTPEMLESSSYYALWNSFSEDFYNQTGIYIDHKMVNNIASRILPYELYKRSTRDIHIDSMFETDNTLQERDSVIKKVGRKKLSKVLPELIKRRGVLIYLGPEVLEQIKPSPEFGDHIIIVRDLPLEAGAITGIEVLSDVERQDLGQ